MRLIEKRVGETPLQALGRLRAEAGIPAEVPLSYAGRLDPMASGTLLVLEGDESKDRARFLALDKEYEVEVLLGAFSDTGDVLGIVTEAPDEDPDLAALRLAGAGLVGPYDAPYPAFSSRTVRGKQLFQWALEGRLDEIEIPLQHGTVRALEVTGIELVTREELRERVMTKLALTPLTDDPRKVLGRNFRVDDAHASWEKLFAATARETFAVARMTVLTSSGVYMRTLADDLAKSAGARALALSIHRSRIFLD